MFRRRKLSLDDGKFCFFSLCVDSCSIAAWLVNGWKGSRKLFNLYWIICGWEKVIEVCCWDVMAWAITSTSRRIPRRLTSPDLARNKQKQPIFTALRDVVEGRKVKRMASILILRFDWRFPNEGLRSWTEKALWLIIFGPVFTSDLELILSLALRLLVE